MNTLSAESRARNAEFERQGGSPGVVLMGPRLEMMSPGEERELLNREDVIQKGLKTFDQVVECLREIREKKLYRAKFATFKEYCKLRWRWSDRRVRQLTDGAEPLESIRSQAPDIRMPENEAQVRPLTRLPKQDQGPAWREAVESAGAAKVTARHVEAVVQARTRKPSGPSSLPSVKSASSQQQQLSNLERRLEGIKAGAIEIHGSPEIQKDRTLSYCARAVLRALDELDLAIARRRAKLCGRS